jgi:hypothetical protein
MSEESIANGKENIEHSYIVSASFIIIQAFSNDIAASSKLNSELNIDPDVIDKINRFYIPLGIPVHCNKEKILDVLHRQIEGMW